MTFSCQQRSLQRVDSPSGRAWLSACMSLEVRFCPLKAHGALGRAQDLQGILTPGRPTAESKFLLITAAPHVLSRVLDFVLGAAP